MARMTGHKLHGTPSMLLMKKDLYTGQTSQSSDQGFGILSFDPGEEDDYVMLMGI